MDSQPMEEPSDKEVYLVSDSDWLLLTTGAGRPAASSGPRTSRLRLPRSLYKPAPRSLYKPASRSASQASAAERLETMQEAASSSQVRALPKPHAPWQPKLTS